MPEPVGPELARRLERAEAMASVAFVEARARIAPEIGARWIEVAGVHAMFDGVESPLSQTFGLGIFDAVGPRELDELEQFFVARGAPVFHEVCALVPPEVQDLLHERSYTSVEESTVLIRPIAPRAAPPPDHPAVRRIDASEAGLWARVAAEGWSSESAELAAFVEQFGLVAADARGMQCFLAEIDGQPVAAGGLNLQTDVALLAGASTIPSARGRGAQLALLEARLAFAAGRGIDLAMVVTLPGSGSERNARRQGFRPAYGRVKWRRDV